MSLRAPLAAAASSSSAVKSGASASSAVPPAIVPAAGGSVDIRLLELAASDMEAGAYLVHTPELVVLTVGAR